MIRFFFSKLFLGANFEKIGGKFKKLEVFCGSEMIVADLNLFPMSVEGGGAGAGFGWYRSVFHLMKKIS